MTMPCERHDLRDWPELRREHATDAAALEWTDQSISASLLTLEKEAETAAISIFDQVKGLLIPPIIGS